MPALPHKRVKQTMPPKASKALVSALEKETGLSIEQLRATPIDERRQILEQRCGFVMRVFSEFPFIGRGNVMNDRVLSREQVNALLDKALR